MKWLQNSSRNLEVTNNDHLNTGNSVLFDREQTINKDQVSSPKITFVTFTSIIRKRNVIHKIQFPFPDGSKLCLRKKGNEAI